MSHFSQICHVIANGKDRVDEWFVNKISQVDRPFIYNSVDVRLSSFKISPVDTNIFPAGFNNLSKSGLKSAFLLARNYLNEFYPSSKKIFIIAENHTRNLHYLDSLLVLSHVLAEAGYEAYIVSIDQLVNEDVELQTALGLNIKIHKATKDKDLIKIINNSVTADLLLLNNDFTSGKPEILENIKQDITPPINFGWYNRRKSEHFTTYNKLAKEFAADFGFDDWFINPMSLNCDNVDFKEGSGFECLSANAEKIFQFLRQKYNDYGIKEQPYIFLKSNYGTYGMGIMTISSVEEIYKTNKKIRNEMRVIKGGTKNTSILLQEGVKTITEIDKSAAEQMVYLMAGEPIDLIYRVNNKKDHYSSLNSSGMHFVNSDHADYTKNNLSSDQIYLSSIVAKLASIACCHENY